MERGDYAEWIRSVRGKMSREAFGKQIYHYTEDGTNCDTYHRNAVGNWEAGGNIPKNTETFLSIALMEYDIKHPGECKSCGERNRRYGYARHLIYEKLGIDLYCRSLHDALLIQVCRGVLTFPEVPELEQKMNGCIQAAAQGIDGEAKRKYALERATAAIESDWYKINDKKEIPEIVEKTSMFFYTWDRTMGAHIVQIFENRQRYVKPLTLENAVNIYAPNYRKSYSQKFLHSSGTSRQWLLDLCVHLRFDREEIQEVLEYAHMAPLSENREDPEFYLRKIDSFSVGSAGWYRTFEEDKTCLKVKKNPGAVPHFGEMKNRSLNEKLQILMLMICCIEEDSFEDLPPIDYLLESFTLYRSGKRKGRGDEAVKKLEHILKKVDPEEWEREELQKQLKSSVKDWIDYVQNGYETAIENSVIEVYEDYRRECSEYYSIPEQYLKNVRNREKVYKLRYIAALFFTVFTGRYYLGELSSYDLEIVKRQFDDSDNVYIYRFISYVLGIFLSQNEIYESEKDSFYILEKNRVKGGIQESKALNLTKIIEYLWGALIELGCTK